MHLKAFQQQRISFHRIYILLIRILFNFETINFPTIGSDLNLINTANLRLSFEVFKSFGGLSSEI